MKYENRDQARFFSEMSEHQLSAREFFCTLLLDSLDRSFGLDRTVILYFDTQGRFLSWISREGILADCEDHPYRRFAADDVIRQMIYQDAVRDHLTYFNTAPRLYQSSDIIGHAGYEQSPYVQFLEKHFQSHYSVSMAFGMNAYIQLVCLKDSSQGDFTEEELRDLEEIYTYVARAYKNFKTYEQARIVSSIQSEIIASGEKAYLVTDDFMHVMSYNKAAQNCLEDLLGPAAAGQISSTIPCGWLPFLLGGEEENSDPDHVRTRVIKNYIFKIYTYDQSYSNGIVDRYHWITISRKKEGASERAGGPGVMPLTKTEQKVAELMYQGLTYRAIAEELVVSYHTIKKHVQNIYLKCGVNSRFELYKWMEDNA